LKGYEDYTALQTQVVVNTVVKVKKQADLNMGSIKREFYIACRRCVAGGLVWDT